MTTENTCTICLTTINNDEKCTLSCNHYYHTECIVNWFRSPNSNGNCPLCNDNPHLQSTEENHFLQYTYTSQFIDERFKLIRNVSRRKSSPPLLKKEFEKYKKIENDYKSHKKDRSVYEKSPEIVEYKKKMKHLNDKEWNYRYRLNKKKNRIVGLFPTLQIF